MDHQEVGPPPVGKVGPFDTGEPPRDARRPDIAGRLPETHKAKTVATEVVRPTVVGRPVVAAPAGLAATLLSGLQVARVPFAPVPIPLNTAGLGATGGVTGAVRPVGPTDVGGRHDDAPTDPPREEAVPDPAPGTRPATAGTALKATTPYGLALVARQDVVAGRLPEGVVGRPRPYVTRPAIEATPARVAGARDADRPASIRPDEAVDVTVGVTDPRP